MPASSAERAARAAPGPSKIKGGEVSPLAPASSPKAAGSSATPLDGAAPRNTPNQDFVTARLGEIIELKRGFDLPQQHRQPGCIPIVSSSGISGFHTQAMMKAPGVVTGRYGTLGLVFFLEEDYWPLNTTLYVKDFKGNDPKFISYFLRSLDFSSCSDKAAVPGLNRNHLHEIPVTCPPIPIQKAIAHILGTLDDGIELCRRMNETLEVMARALFKDWFVDFGPVRAKMDGREPPGLPPEIAALFPDKLVDSAVGEIPDGWSVRSIYDISSVIYGAPFASEQFNSAGIGKPLVRIRDLKHEAPGVYTDEIHPKGYLIQPGDIVVGMDGEFRAYLWGGETAWLNQRVCVFKPSEKIPSSFVRESIIPLLSAVEESETATTVIHLGKNDIDRFRIRLPSQEILAAFGDATNRLYEEIVGLKHKARILSNLRDTLLPKLLSGELRVNETLAG